MSVPDDVTDALRVFAGEDEAINRAVHIAGIARDHLIPCVDDYVRKILIHDKADALRVLGLQNDQDKLRMRLHRKLLLQRLHPDKSNHEDDVVYARRVLNAWKVLGAATESSEQTQVSEKRYRGPRLRWIRVPGERFSVFGLIRRVIRSLRDRHFVRSTTMRQPR